MIISDQKFQVEPNISNGSDANEVAPEILHYCKAGLQIPPLELPVYVIFAISYKDKEKPLAKPMHQIWYFKWAGTENGKLSEEIMYTSIEERDNILSHMKDKLKDYLE
jgi:hypothetical protein